ncbi:MAG: HEPN domain-containing protein [bacterium]
MKEVVTGWLKVAENDFASADSLAKDELFESACFHSQQAVEKYLKAYLIAHKKQFLKVHDLEYLVKLSQEIDSEFEKLRESAQMLTDFAIMYRYPLDEPVACSEVNFKRSL